MRATLERSMMLKAYRYKLEPNKQQRYALARTLDVCRELYNDSLAQRNYNYKSGNKCYYQEQQNELPALKAAFPVHKQVYSQVLQNVLNRLDKTFKNFFRSGFGFPRFKSQNRYDSFCYPQGGFSLDGNQLSLSKVGNVKVRLSRELPADAVIKTCTIKRSVNGWFATLAFEYQPVLLPANDLAVGIDVGVTTFATFSDGMEIQNPRIYQNAQAELRRAQRRVARRTKGSNRRRKAVVLLQKVHARITAKRHDFLHKHSTAVIKKYGTVVVESLNVAGMSRSNLAKQILDCSWSEFFRMLKYKAEGAGRRVEEIDPRYTSQTCSECGFVHRDNRKTQADFVCVSCGHTDNADHNGAVNILGRIDLSFVNDSAVMLA
jgi:putative transposase